MRDEPQRLSQSASGNPAGDHGVDRPATPPVNSRASVEFTPPGEAAQRGSDRWRPLAAVIVYSIFLVIPELLGRSEAILPAASVWELQTVDGLADWAGEVAFRAFWEFLRFVPLGILLVWAAGRCGNSPSAFRRGTMALAAGMLLTWLLVTVEVRGFPDAGRLLLPLLGCGVGSWIGAGAVRGPVGLIWLVPQFGAALLLTAGAGFWFVDMALEPAPLPFDPPEVTSAEKRRLVSKIRYGQTVQEDSVLLGKLRFTEHDVNVLAAWGLTLEDADRKARFEFQGDRVIGAASVRVPAPSAERSYLNVRFRGRFSIEHGHPRVAVEELQVGGVELPSLVVRLLAGRVESLVMGDKNIAQVVKSIRSADVDDDTVQIVYRKDEIDVRVLPKLVGGLGQKPDVVDATREHVRHLMTVGASLPAGRGRFPTLLQAAFRYAAERSTSGNAALENRAAIYALAMLWGHPRVEVLVGPVMDSELRLQARPDLRAVSIRGRYDWTRHFFVSSALALLSSEAFSDAVGLLKEELDAGRGGSGFSFGDLLADRAGTLFALAATRDDASARRLQEFLSGPFDVDDVVPPAADLPEGLSDAELQSQYGGVNGAGYREVVEEIERRLANCRALQ